MGTEKNDKKWIKFLEATDQISVRLVAVFENGAEAPVDRDKFVDQKGRAKVDLSGEYFENQQVVVFKKEFAPSYWEVNMRFPKGAKIGRQSEEKPFDVRSQDSAFGYCYLRIMGGAPFESVFLANGWRTYKLAVREEANVVRVQLWPKVDLPDCLR